MKIEILRNTVADGRDVFTGETHEVSVDTAGILIALGKAQLATDTAPEKPVAPVIETAEARHAPERAEAPHAKKKK